MPVVTMPDGVPVAFPDEMPPDQIRALILQKFPNAAELAKQPAPTPAPMPAPTAQPGPPPDMSAQARINSGAEGLPPAAPTPAAPAATPQRGNLNVGVQGAAKGLGELVFGVPDIVNTGVNLGLAGADKASRFVGGPAIDFRFGMPSEIVARRTAEAVEPLGITTTDPAAMTLAEKLGYNTNRMGAQVAGAVPFLARAGARRATEALSGDSLPVWYDPLVRPYAPSPGNPVTASRTIAGDAAGAAGAGVGVSAAQEYAPDNPLAAAGGVIGGGIGGTTALSIGESLLNMGKLLARKLTGIGTTARDIPVDPTTGAPVANSTADLAARMVQNEVSPETLNQPRADAVAAARGRISGNQVELGGLVSTPPTSAALAENPGLSVLERRVAMQNPGQAIAQERNFNSAVRDTVDQVAPEGATAQPLIERAQQEIDARRAAAQGQVDRAQGRVERVEGIRGQDANDLRLYRGRGEPASANIDRTLRQTRTNELEQSRRLYNDPALTNAEVPDTPLVDAANNIRAQATPLSPVHPAVEPFLQRIEAGETETVPMRGVNGLIADIEQAIAQNMDNGLAVRQLKSLKTAAASLIGELPAGSPARVAADRARENYQTRVGPTFREGAGGEFDQALRRDDTRVRPSETADRFLTRPEDAQQLIRISALRGNEAQVAGQARVWLMDKLSRTGVVRNDALDPDLLAKWSNVNRDLIDSVPGLRGQIDDLADRARRGERVAGMAEERLGAAQRSQKQTERDLNRSAFQQVVNADPDKAVAAIMNDPTSSGRRLKELIDLTEGNANARTGLKAAVRDYMIDKATNTGSEALRAGDTRGPVSQAKLTRIFNEHENELAQIFSPAEMNVLRAGHKALDLAGVNRLRVSKRSDTAENFVDVVERLRETGLGKGIEAALRVKYGLLKTGGLIATGRRLTAGFGKDEADQAMRLVERAAYDPDLMKLLLGRELPVGSPRWNARLNALLGAAEGGREAYD